VNITVQLPKNECLRTENCKEKNLQKKKTSVRTLTTLIRMLSVTKIHLPKASLYFKRLSTMCQQRRMGRMDSMVSLNISRVPMVEQNYKGEQPSLNSERPSSASSDYNRCSPRSMGSNTSDSEE
jgi:hypothetical protein